MTDSDIAAVVGLQAAAFPPPFPPEQHWQSRHIAAHLARFPEGQFVAEIDGHVVGSCSNTLVSETVWQSHGSWIETVGGPSIEGFDPNGSTLYGLDITVHPDVRRRGVGRAFYEARYDFVRRHRLVRYGTGCRLPDFLASGVATPEQYAAEVIAGRRTDRTLTPLLRYGLTFIAVLRNYMPDVESANAAALLEWLP